MLPRRGVAAANAFATAGSGPRLRLLENFLEHNDAARCVSTALEWLAAELGIVRSLCLVRQPGAPIMSTIAAHGLPWRTARNFTVQLDLLDDPLVSALGKRWPTCFPAAESPAERRQRPSTPFEGARLHAVPLWEPGERTGPSGVLFLPDLHQVPPAAEWLSTVLALKLGQVLNRQALEQAHSTRARDYSLLQAVFNAMSDPVLMTDTEGRLLLANHHAEAIFVAEDTETEGRRRAVNMNNMLFSAALSINTLEASGITRSELLLVDPADGSDLAFELLCTVTQNVPGGPGVVAVLRNVNDLRRVIQEMEDNYRQLRAAGAHARAERDRLNAIIDSVDDPITVTDAAGETSLMNVTAERFFAVSSTATKASLRRVQTNDARLSSFIAGMLASTDRERVGKIELLDPEMGKVVPVEAVAKSMLSEQGELTGVASILHDQSEVLEKTRLNEQLQRASDELEQRIQAATADIAQQNVLLRRQTIQLEQASALKTQFLANMSHEFRTPLNAALGYTSMLLQGVTGPLDAAARRAVERIESNGRHLLTVVNEILDISRIEAGRMPLQVVTFDLSRLVNEVRSEIEPIVDASSVSMRIRLDKRLPPVSSDRQKVKQILLNLASNALKFTSEGSVTIDARLLARDEQIAISVVDTGVGIAPANHEKIFEMFQQVDDSPTRAYGGTGLGLAISRRLAHILSGELTVRSAVGRGSTFTLTLPIRLRRRGAQKATHAKTEA